MSCDSKSVLRALREVTTLRSQRLSFERFSAEYVSAEYVAWMNHPEIRRWLVSCQGKETTKTDLEKYVDGLGPDEEIPIVWVTPRRRRD